MSWVSSSFIGGRSASRFSVLSLVLAGVCLFSGSGVVSGQAINEDFASLSTLLTQDWFTTNRSNPINPLVTGWDQCSGTNIPPAQSGSTNSCVLANFESGTGTATLSNWLIGPTRTFNNGDTLSFYTRTRNNNFPDRMQVRLSTSGTSTNVGSSEFDVGAFTTLLLDIDPTYQGTYPIVWTQFTITLSGLPAEGVSGRFAFRYFVEDGGPDGANSNIIGLDTLVYTPASGPTNQQHVLDFDGDGKTDYAVVRNTGGGPSGQLTWYIKRNTGSESQEPFGLQGDQFVPVDYDGDNKTDIAIWRSGVFYILQSASGTLRVKQFGQTGDDASVVDDYTGDGLADLAVYRSGLNSGDQSTWWYLASSGPNNGLEVPTAWGKNGDFPSPGDYDGDGKADFVVQRNDGGGEARFYTLLATGAQPDTFRFGTPTDVIVPGDYDGDGKTDIALARSVGGRYTWYIRSSGTGNTFAPTIFGLSATDFVTPGDYDGDGSTDLSVWRFNSDPNENYFFWQSVTSSAAGQVEWGQQGDYPVANYNRH